MKILRTNCIERSGENGYEHYRIPGICATEKGTLFVYYEARHGGDWSVIDLYCKRSIDGGKTWKDRQMLFSGKRKNTVNNPCMIADGEKLHLLCFENYKRMFHMESADEGETWSAPVEITDVPESCAGIYPWTCAAVGPGHGMRLSGGRLIAPMWLAANPENITLHGPSKIASIYSDDRGKTWHMGEVFVPEGSISPNESCFAELSDGGVLMNIRSVKPEGATIETEHYRYIAISRDGGISWQETRKETQLPDPCCCGGMCNIPGGILFTNCNSFAYRVNHTLRRSSDDGRTWRDALLYDTKAGYSDCIYNPKTGTAFAAYEHDHETEMRVSEVEL